MYSKRIKFFIVLSIVFLVVCLARLAEIQLCSRMYYQEQVEALKAQRGKSRLLGTLRGRIIDRTGRELAINEPKFQLNLTYGLTCVMDERVIRMKLMAAEKSENPVRAEAEVKKWVDTKWEDLERVIDKCSHFGFGRDEVENRIRKKNDQIWSLRLFHAWRSKGISKEILEKYDNSIISIPSFEAVADFEKRVPDEGERLDLIRKVNITEMKDSWQLLELMTDDDVFTAQFEFLGVEGVEVVAKVTRVYPYGSVASQTIGWVGRAENETLEFDDKLKYYLPGEVCGRQPGVEYVCESILRGKRGKVNYDIDNKLIEKTETEFGEDVQLTLDIELQKKIEAYLSDPNHNQYCKLPTAAAVIDVKSGDILAMVSLPDFDLNRVRYDYGRFINDSNHPMINRVINSLYPPGSIVKPLVLVAGLEEGKIRASETISCPHERAPKGWPNCLALKFGSCHDWQWDGQGGNIGRNAIRGSCNIYFSRLADRLQGRELQGWLYKFGLGHSFELCPQLMMGMNNQRSLMQADGVISSRLPKGAVDDFNDVPSLDSGEKRYFGMGQGSIRATPLQLVNAIASIARGGVYKPARLFVEKNNNTDASAFGLGISPGTLAVVRDGMRAVVNEAHGTANRVFSGSDFDDKGVKVYGKTGSTQSPEHAWFAGFAEGAGARSVAIAVLVERGQSGAGYAAPLGRAIFELCLEAGYLGQVN